MSRNRNILTKRVTPPTTKGHGKPPSVDANAYEDGHIQVFLDSGLSLCFYVDATGARMIAEALTDLADAIEQHACAAAAEKETPDERSRAEKAHDAAVERELAGVER